MTGNRYEDCCTVLNNINDTKTAPQELVESQQKAVMSMWWSLVQAFWKRFGPDPIREEKLTEAIKQWCLEVTKDYEADQHWGLKVINEEWKENSKSSSRICGSANQDQSRVFMATDYRLE
ncbi:hypothetical protein ANCDUO_14972 [Ancylostoma duodenale]|uniref:Uncharacterized protein n=1 Tax=Ancylostoma duodenale TaxID=51022 RepID=A0A0C2G7L8_9BILA|nr:hypothetical protein ANCDUO_14972 [Ancylostoma duodenale]